MATYASVMRARERESRKKTPSAECVCVSVCGGERKTASMSAANRRSIFVCRHSPSTSSSPPHANRSYQYCPARTVQRTRNLKSNNFDTNHYLNTKFQIPNTKRVHNLSNKTATVSKSMSDLWEALTMLASSIPCKMK